MDLIFKLVYYGRFTREDVLNMTFIEVEMTMKLLHDTKRREQEAVKGKG